MSDRTRMKIRRKSVTKNYIAKALRDPKGPYKHHVEDPDYRKKDSRIKSNGRWFVDLLED